MINLMNQALFLQPLPSHLSRDYSLASGAQPHMIYKRSLHDVVGRGCDVGGKNAVVKFYLRTVHRGASLNCLILKPKEGEPIRRSRIEITTEPTLKEGMQPSFLSAGHTTLVPLRRCGETFSSKMV